MSRGKQDLLGKPLTKRQAEVMDLLIRGKDNTEIGMILGISRSTARNHINACCRRLDAHSRVLLAVKYIDPERFKK